MGFEVSVEAIAALRRREGFVEAMRANARANLMLFRGNSLLNTLMNDRARAVFMLVALYLHFAGTPDGRHGLTVGALKDMCVRLDLCSRGRCEAMLAILRAAGCFEAAPHDDRRRRPLVPTAKLIALQKERWRTQLGAAVKVIPAARAHIAAIDDPDFVRRFVLALGEPFIGGFRLIQHAPDLLMFADRSAGVPILFSLALEGPEDGVFPPDGPVRLSINKLATQFGVSRKHVLTLLRDAEAQGLLSRGVENPDRVTLLPRLRDGLEILLATIFLYLTGAAERALAAQPNDAVEPVA